VTVPVWRPTECYSLAILDALDTLIPLEPGCIVLIDVPSTRVYTY
jgi:hypothetical protein